MAGKYYAPYPLRVSKELMKKVKYIAAQHKRSANKEIEYILEQYAAGFEQDYEFIAKNAEKEES